MPIFTIKNDIEVSYASPDFDRFIKETLTVYNPKYLENQRMKRSNWNTPRNLYFYVEDENKRLFVPRGFLKDLSDYCVVRGIPFRLKDQTHLFSNANFSFLGKLKPFQQDAMSAMLSENMGTLCAPTASGKTVMALYLISQRQQPAIIIVHTKELLHQWVERIETFLKIPKKLIGKIGDGSLEKGQKITVALVQTLRNYPEAVNDYGYLVVDEAHRTPAKTFTEIIDKYVGRYILGLSATPFRNDQLSSVIEWYAGRILCKIQPKELIKEGHITGVSYVVRKTFFSSRLPDPAAEYSTLLQELSQNDARNEMIVDDIIEATRGGETCLVLTDRKAHCQELKTLILQRRKISTAVLTGETPKKERTQITQFVNEGRIKVLIATAALIGEGFDCKNLTALFLTLPIKYSGRIIQYVGRVLRTKKGKIEAKIYDYFDPNIKCLYGGLKNREKVYKELLSSYDGDKK